MAGTGPENLPALQTPAQQPNLSSGSAQRYDILACASVRGQDAHVFSQLIEEIDGLHQPHP